MTGMQSPPAVHLPAHTIVFVIHGGELEVKSALLAASLHRHYVPRQVVARLMEPVSRWGGLMLETRKILDRCGVRIEPGVNRIDDTYPHGNKLTAFEGINGPALFLDSDMLMLVPFLWHFGLHANFAAKPADVDTFVHGGGSWAAVWDAFNLPLPPPQFVAEVSQEIIRPYFNAGCIAVSDASSFGQVWLDCAKRIDANPAIINKRPWLDQIALPVAAALMRWGFHALDDRMNYPCHKMALGPTPPYLAHYHTPDVIAQSPRLLHHVGLLMAEHPELRTIMGCYENWAVILTALEEQKRLSL